MSIGFYNSDPPSPPPTVPAAPGAALFTFDDGDAISFPEASHHTLVTGTTGCGKTTSFILPSLKNLMAAKFSGLVIDIKGNMIEHTLALARACGREQDVIEFGNGPQAQPLNILKGLDSTHISNLFTALTEDSFGGASQNKDFYVRGVKNTVDLAQMLGYLAAIDPRCQPSLSFVEELINNIPMCARLYALLKAKADSLENKNDKNEADKLIKAIESNSLHPCRWAEEKRHEEFDVQIEYQLGNIRTALKNIVDTPGIVRAFCTSGGAPLDIADLIYNQAKIVVLRFTPGAGPAGEFLARYFKENFYEAVYTHGLAQPPDRYTFVVGDEFQDFANFNPSNRFSDNSFTARSREFRNILVVGAQSVAALGNRGGYRDMAEAFVNNCNNRIMMYSDDPWTQRIADRHQAPLLTALQPGEAAVVKFEAATRKHTHGQKFLQNAHDAGQADLRAFAGVSRLSQPEPPCPASPRLEDILDSQPEPQKGQSPGPENMPDSTPEYRGKGPSPEDRLGEPPERQGNRSSLDDIMFGGLPEHRGNRPRQENNLGEPPERRGNRSSLDDMFGWPPEHRGNRPRQENNLGRPPERRGNRPSLDDIMFGGPPERRGKRHRRKKALNRLPVNIEKLPGFRDQKAISLDRSENRYPQVSQPGSRTELTALMTEIKVLTTCALDVGLQSNLKNMLVRLKACGDELSVHINKLASKGRN